MKRRMVIQVLVAVLVTVGSVGCGSKATTSPIVMPTVDTAPPAAVTGMSFRVNQTQTPNIVLNWDPGSELDLVGYRVYRTLVPDGTSGRVKRGVEQITAMQLMDTVTMSAFNDRNVMNGSSCAYSVSAIDASGNESSWVSTTPLRVDVSTRSTELELN